MVRVDSWRSAYRGIVPDNRLERLDCARGAERFRDAIVTGPEELYVTEEGGAITGFLVLGPCRDSDIDARSTGEIWGMYLSSPYWRRGIGRSMCREAEGTLKSRGHSGVVLWVFEDNQRARRFYEAMGFTSDGARKVLDIGASLNAVRYRKSI
jgi:ribosomal protein S18 acetylase RimI-like enzyme